MAAAPTRLGAVLRGLGVPATRDGGRAFLLTVGVVLGNVALTVGAAALFRHFNADIPDDLLRGLLPATQTPAAVGAALHARNLWLASIVVVLIAAVGALFLAVSKVWKEPAPLRGRVLVLLLVAIPPLAAAAALSDVAREVVQAAILEPTIGAYGVGGIPLEAFATLRRIDNAVVAGATVAVVLGIAVRAGLGLEQALAAREPAPDALQDRVRDLHHLLLAGAAILVALVFTMTAWLSWASAGLPEEGGAAAVVEGAAMGIGVYWGTIFTLTLVIAYLPFALYLRQRMAEAARAGGAEGLRPRGLRPFETLGDAAALLSPLASALLPLFLV